MENLGNKILALLVVTCAFLFATPLHAQQKTFGEELTKIFQEVWPYKAFLAIPSIKEISPRLIIPINIDGIVKEGTRCAEVDDLDMLREINPKAVLPKENLYRLSCKSLLAAIDKIATIPIPRNGFSEDTTLVLKFYFGTGTVQVLTY